MGPADHHAAQLEPRCVPGGEVFSAPSGNPRETKGANHDERAVEDVRATNNVEISIDLLRRRADRALPDRRRLGADRLGHRATEDTKSAFIVVLADPGGLRRGEPHHADGLRADHVQLALLTGGTSRRTAARARSNTDGSPWRMNVVLADTRTALSSKASWAGSSRGLEFADVHRLAGKPLEKLDPVALLRGDGIAHRARPVCRRRRPRPRRSSRRETPAARCETETHRRRRAGARTPCGASTARARTPRRRTSPAPTRWSPTAGPLSSRSARRARSCSSRSPSRARRWKGRRARRPSQARGLREDRRPGALRPSAAACTLLQRKGTTVLFRY